MVNDFDDVGLPPKTDDYFETNNDADISYTYENTARDMIIDEGIVGEFSSEHKDLIPRLMHPDDFKSLQNNYELKRDRDDEIGMGSPDSKTFERMKLEYEKLYSEFLTKYIRADKEKQALQQKLNRVGVIQRMLSKLVCDR